jgi:uncharacterized protein (TIGR02452 family)
MAREPMDNRAKRASIAQQTLDILKAGYYSAPSGNVIAIKSDLDDAIQKSQLYKPADFPANISQHIHTHNLKPSIEVTEETTLAAARRLAQSDVVPTCLNFASAKNAGGGFLSGSQAQEESLARASGLYPCIVQMNEMYEYNRKLKTCLYSDHLIFSPRVPVFRDDTNSLLENSYLASFITAPAVNAGAVKRNEPKQRGLIKPTMATRLEKVLWIASQHDSTTLVLGAWGCGVFGNEASMIAQLFADALSPAGAFYGCFKQIVFAVYDRTPNKESHTAFQKQFAQGVGVSPP